MMKPETLNRLFAELHNRMPMGYRFVLLIQPPGGLKGDPPIPIAISNVEQPDARFMARRALRSSLAGTHTQAGGKSFHQIDFRIGKKRKRKFDL